MSERKLRDIMKSLSNARYTYNQPYNPPHQDNSDCDDYDDIEHDFMTDEM